MDIFYPIIPPHRKHNRPATIGIDVYRLVTSVGWDIYPIGSGARPEDMPKPTLAGIVIVE